jgi:hypothetical protein
MIKLIQKLTIALAVALLAYIGYMNYKNNAIPWKNFSKPQLASFASLEQEEVILNELKKQREFGSYKPLDPVFFVKPDIFNTISR